VTELLGDNLPVGYRKSADGTRYEFGVTINGGFVAFSSAQANAFEDDLKEAQEAAQEAAASQPVAPVPPAQQ
jgi:hypothetical protein